DEETWERFGRANEADPFCGIRFATLLDPVQTAAVAQMVTSWGHETVHTVDGGIVRVNADTISFGVHDRKATGVTDMAIQMAIREGIARGWETFKVSGTPDFARRFQKYALAAGIKA